MKTLDEFIESIKQVLFEQSSIEVALYHYLKKEDILDIDNFSGEIEIISMASFQDNFLTSEDLEKVQKKVNNLQYEKSINIYNWIGLALQEKLQDNNSTFFENKLRNKFKEHSFKYKYLISKVFENYTQELTKFLRIEIDSQNPFILILKHLFLEESININDTLKNFQKEENYDIIDLLLLEDLRDIQSISYNKIQKKLLDDILWVLGEIQSNHKNYNNNEDQYNSAVRSLLTAKGYKVQDQTQRGQSSTGKSTGELDIAIFTNNSIPLSIFEAFILESIDSASINKHLLKLSEDYDANGIKQNYAVIYAKSADFEALWIRYKDFVTTINFEYKIINNYFQDITKQYPNYAGLRIGKTKHQNRGVETIIYHIFLDINFN